MYSDGQRVSSHALRGLQDGLNGLSNQIQGICDTLNSDRDRVGDAWCDQKYQEFKQGFQKQIDKCSHIAERYHQWGVSVLDPAIAKVETIEKADVVGDGSSSSGAVSGSGSGPLGAGGSNGLAQESAAQAGASQRPRIVPRPKNNTQAMKNEAGSNSATDFPTGGQSPVKQEKANSNGAVSGSGFVGDGGSNRLAHESAAPQDAAPKQRIETSNENQKKEIPKHNWVERNFPSWVLPTDDTKCVKTHGGTYHAVPVSKVKGLTDDVYFDKISVPSDEIKVGVDTSVAGKVPLGSATLEAKGGPNVSYTSKTAGVDSEIACISEKTMEKLSNKYGIEFE